MRRVVVPSTLIRRSFDRSVNVLVTALDGCVDVGDLGPFGEPVDHEDVERAQPDAG
jgi:hypothetical protein